MYQKISTIKILWGKTQCFPETKAGGHIHEDV